MYFNWDYENMIKRVFSKNPFSDRFVIKRNDDSKYQMEIYSFDDKGNLKKYQRHRRILGGAEVWTYKNGEEYEHYFESGGFGTSYMTGEYKSSTEHHYVHHDFHDWTKHDEYIPIEDARKKFRGPFFDSNDEYMKYF